LGDVVGGLEGGRELVLELTRFGMPELLPGDEDEKIDLLSEAQEESVRRVRRCRASLWRFLLALPLPPAAATAAGVSAGLDLPSAASAREEALSAGKGQQRREAGAELAGGRAGGPATTVLRRAPTSAGNATELRKVRRRRARRRREEQLRVWWRQSQALSLLERPSEQMHAWQVTHQRLLLALCHHVDHEPWQLFDDYPEASDEGSDVVVARWTESTAAPLSTGSADAWALQAFEKCAEPLGGSGRWMRMMADPGVTATSSGSLVSRHADPAAASRAAAAAVAGVADDGGDREEGEGEGDGVRGRIGEAEAGGWGNIGSGGAKAMRWRDFLAAHELWDAIAYDTWNGTYPQLAFLAPDERPGDRGKLEALQRKEDDGTLTEKEAEELWYREELHYDVMYGLFPATVLPEELQHMVTRIIYLYVRLAPPGVSYNPDMHRVLAPLLYVAMRDPDHGLRDTLVDRELHIAATGHDHVEAHAVAMLISFSSQILRHWAPVAGAGGHDVAALLSARVMERLFQTDEELALKLWGPMGLSSNSGTSSGQADGTDDGQGGGEPAGSGRALSAEDMVRPHLATLFASTLPLPELLPLWEALLAAPDRNAFLVDVCVAMLSAPALRLPLMLADSPERARLLVEIPPAIRTDDLLISAARLARRVPHSPLALAPLLPRDEAMAGRWGGESGD